MCDCLRAMVALMLWSPAQGRHAVSLAKPCGHTPWTLGVPEELGDLTRALRFFWVTSNILGDPRFFARVTTNRVSRAVLDPVEICLNIAGNVSENMSVVSGVFKNTAACI